MYFDLKTLCVTGPDYGSEFYSSEYNNVKAI